MSEESADPGVQQGPHIPERRARTLQRVTAFTDAAVAIALTLLALPLVDFADESPARQSVANLFVQHLGDIVSFLVSFLVIALFWRTHRHLYERLVDYDEWLLVLNTIWLMLVVFLPFPTARLFVETRLRTDSAVLYLGNMLAVGLVTLAQTWWVLRRRELRSPPSPGAPRELLPSMGLSVVFAAATLAALASPVAGLLVLVLVPPVQLVAARLARPRAAAESTTG
jgi:uncharacterized membrane protein